MDKTKLTYKVARKIYDSYRFLVADFKIKNLKKVTNTKKKIVFISQMSNLWINVDDLYNQLSNDDQFETYVLMIPEFDYSKKEFDKLIENCGNILMLPDEEIYDINKFNKLLKKELAQINLDEEIKIDKNINDIKKLLDKRKIIKHIYIMLEKEDYNKKIINTIVDIFSKEYLIALYLKSIK